MDKSKRSSNINSSNRPNIQTNTRSNARSNNKPNNNKSYTINKPQQNTRKTAKVKSKIDIALFLIVLALVLFGIMMVYSSSYYVSALNNNDSTYYLRRQAMYAMIGFIAMYFTTNFDYKLYNSNIAIWLYGLSLLLVLYAGFFGVSSHGASRWISIAGFSIQPSELAKASIIIMSPYLIVNNKELLSTLKGHVQLLLPTLVMTLCVAKENLSTAIIIFVIGVGVLFLASPRIKEFVILGTTGILLMYTYLLLASKMEGEFRGARYNAWKDPFAYADTYGFQIIQSLYAVASGGFFGLGLGKSRQKLSFIPEAHNDIIFAIICEELGFLGAAIVLLLFALLVWRVFTIALKSKNLFSSLIASGFAIMIATQVIINVAVVTNTIPNTGIPMPFISSGGSALVTAMGLTGIVLNISKSVDLE